ncbi:MAG: hypothetical protein ABI981_00770 [Betaproteobacteria bacterium]
MTRYKQPDSPEDRRRARRAPIVAALFVGALALAARSFHSGHDAPMANAAVATQVVSPSAPETLSFSGTLMRAESAEDARITVGDSNRDPRYYDELVRR